LLTAAGKSYQIMRTTQPEVQVVEHIELIKPHIFDVTETVPLLWMKDVANDTVRLELHFDAGIIRGQKSIPSIVHSLIFSGTGTKTSVQIHEEIDALGGFLDTDISLEGAMVTVYCLREHLDAITKLVAEAIGGLSFRENEVEDTLRSMSHRFQENKMKVKIVAQHAFRELIFGSDPSYSSVAQAPDFESADVPGMKRFFRDHYLNGLTRITLVGNVEQDDVDALIDRFGKWAMSSRPSYQHHFERTVAEVKRDVPNTVQSAVRMGRILFNRRHPDYIDVVVLNTILGDYFGSRLMSNIREDKGYTYGIGSAILELHEAGYLVIVTEVGSEVTAETLKEIRIEMDRLRTEQVSAEELDLVKNYVLGQLLKSADGPYCMMDLYNSVDTFGLGLDFYDEFIRKVRAITPGRVLELAAEYLDPKDFLVITAG
jgi:zinc protease